MTLSIYQFAQWFYIFKTINRHFYFALSALGGSLFIFFAIVISFCSEPETILALHRLRILALMVCAAAWFYCMYELYGWNYTIPKIFFYISLAAACTAPTGLLLSLPIQHVEVTRFGIDFRYCFGTTRVAYSFYAAALLACFVFTISRVIFTKTPDINKSYGLLAFLPGVAGGINDFGVTHGFFTSIMLTEYFILIFFFVVFMLFIREEQRNYYMLQELNLHLEQQVQKRTEQLKNANKQLMLAATTDSLTGLVNSAELRKCIHLENERLKRYNSRSLTIIFLDLDNFKYYNDTFGHHAGDFLLKQFAEIVKENYRSIDTTARYGGDEFVIMMPDTNPEKSIRSLERLYHRLGEEEYFKPSLEQFLGKDIVIPSRYRLNFSAGIAEYQPGVSLKELIVMADKALYVAKQTGKSAYTVWDGITTTRT